MAPAAKPLKFNTTKPSTSSKGKTTTSTTANVKVEQKEEKVLSLETAQFKRAYREAAKEMGPPSTFSLIGLLLFCVRSPSPPPSRVGIMLIGLEREGGGSGREREG